MTCLLRCRRRRCRIMKHFIIVKVAAQVFVFLLESAISSSSYMISLFIWKIVHFLTSEFADPQAEEKQNRRDFSLYLHLLSDWNSMAPRSYVSEVQCWILSWYHSFYQRTFLPELVFVLLISYLIVCFDYVIFLIKIQKLR